VSLLESLFALVNRTAELNARPFDPTTPTLPPRDCWGIAHYGVMVPDLPEPFRFLDAIVILGTARAPIFGTRDLVTTTPEDSAWILTGSGVTPDTFRPYSISDECSIADAGELRFGDELVITRSPDEIAVSVTQPDATAELVLNPTAAVSHFAHIPCIYDHWSVLCEYRGQFSSDDGAFTRNGLCTYEYARAVNLPLPFLFFTYQIINIDDDTQVLMTEVLGPAGLPVHRCVYLRHRNGTSSTHLRGFRHVVLEEAPERLLTPDGHLMPMPKQLRWSVDNADGTVLISIDATTNDDFTYGLGAGYAGSCHYRGRFNGKRISGTGYIEWIDRR
jgi:hypothetical protein